MYNFPTPPSSNPSSSNDSHDPCNFFLEILLTFTRKYLLHAHQRVLNPSLHIGKAQSPRCLPIDRTNVVMTLKLIVPFMIGRVFYLILFQIALFLGHILLSRCIAKAITDPPSLKLLSLAISHPSHKGNTLLFWFMPATSSKSSSPHIRTNIPQLHVRCQRGNGHRYAFPHLRF